MGSNAFTDLRYDNPQAIKHDANPRNSVNDIFSIRRDEFSVFQLNVAV